MQTPEERMRDLLQAGVLLIDSMLADQRDWKAKLEAWTASVGEIGGRPAGIEVADANGEAQARYHGRSDAGDEDSDD